MFFLPVYVASISHKMRYHRILELLDAFLCGGPIGTLLAPFQWDCCKTSNINKKLEGEFLDSENIVIWEKV